MFYFTCFTKGGIAMDLREKRKDYLFHLLWLLGIIPLQTFKNYFVCKPQAS